MSKATYIYTIVGKQRRLHADIAGTFMEVLSGKVAFLPEEGCVRVDQLGTSGYAEVVFHRYYRMPTPLGLIVDGRELFVGVWRDEDGFADTIASIRDKLKNIGAGNENGHG